MRRVGSEKGKKKQQESPDDGAGQKKIKSIKV
jgi:hypothetical protein